MDNVGQAYLIFCAVSLIPSVVLTLLTYPEIARDEPKLFWRMYNAINIIVMMTCVWPIVLLGFIPYYFQMRKIERIKATWEDKLREMEVAHTRFSDIIVLDSSQPVHIEPLSKSELDKLFDEIEGKRDD